MKQKINVKKEWKILKYEIVDNKPHIDSPYPADIVRQRGLLLLAQSLLSKYEFTKSKKEKKLLGNFYRDVMDFYLNSQSSFLTQK